MTSTYSAQASIQIQTDAQTLWNTIVNPYKNKLVGFSKDHQPILEIGSALLFKGIFQDREYQDKGFVTRLEPYSVFEYSYWSVFWDTLDIPENYCLIRYEIKEENQKTRLGVIQNGYKSHQEAESSSQNWAGTLAAIKQMLEPA
jgi:Activator of Hsp90 ATPase homolog 1-like protein